MSLTEVNDYPVNGALRKPLKPNSMGGEFN
jgi:hypothetical protein